LRVVICGAQSVGKTTLLNELRKQDELINHQFLVETTRQVQSLGFGINLDATDITQKLIVNQHLANLMLYDDFVADRGTIDSYIYTYYFHKLGKVNSETLDLAKRALWRTISVYHAIFFIKPEFDLVEDGVRSTNLVFRDAIHTMMEELIGQFRGIGFTNIYDLSGTVEKRTTDFMEIFRRINVTA